MAVNAKDFSAAFFHISSLKNATQVTTLPRQNNQIHFGFGKNITVFSRVFSDWVHFSPRRFYKRACMCRIGKCPQWPHLYTTYGKTYNVKQAQDDIFVKNRLSSEPHFKILYFGAGRPYKVKRYGKMFAMATFIYNL